MTEDNNINKLFRDVFENLEVTPPVSVKMEIDKELGPKRKFRFIFWWLPVLLLLLGSVAFAVLRNGSNESEIKKTEAASSLNSGSVEHGFSSSDRNSEIPSSSNHSGQNRNDDKEPTDKEVQQQTTEQSGYELKEKELAQRDVKHQRITAENEHKVQAHRKGSVLKGQADSSKPAKRKTTFKPNKSKKETKGNLVNVLPAGTGSKGMNNASGNPKQKPGSEKTAVSGSSEETDPVDAKSKLTNTSPGTDGKLDDQSARKEPVDSIQKPDSQSVAAETDSLLKSVEEPAKEKPSKNDSKARNWMVELYGGPRFGAKTSKTEFALKEAASYQIGLGFSRKLELGPLKYVTLDGEYGLGKESYKQNITTNSVYFVGIDSIPYFDTIGDTIPAGYTYFNDYDTTTSTIENTRNSTVTRFAFGLKTQFNFNLGAGFGLAVVPGYYYSMNKFKFSDSGSISSSSSQILLGLGVYYDWNRFRFRVGLDTRYELMKKNTDLFIDRRKSMLFLPQFGIAVKF